MSRSRKGGLRAARRSAHLASPRTLPGDHGQPKRPSPTLRPNIGRTGMMATRQYPAEGCSAFVRATADGQGEGHPAAFSAAATPPIGLPRPYSMPPSRLLPETPSSQNELEIKMSQADFPDHAAIVNVRLRVQRDCGRSRRNSSPSCLMSCVPMRAPAIGRNEDSF